MNTDSKAVIAANDAIGTFETQVIVPLNQKGGVGKTTITVNLAATAAEGEDPDDSKILVVSVDPQQSAVDWAERCGESLPFDFAQVGIDLDLAAIAEIKASGKYRYIFLDTPGTLVDRETVEEALDLADLVLVIIECEPMSFGPTQYAITVEVEPRGLDYVVVVNNWDPRDGEEVRNQTTKLVDEAGWPRAKTVVRHYRVHTNAIMAGKVCTQYAHNHVSTKGRMDFYRLALDLGLGRR